MPVMVSVQILLFQVWGPMSFGLQGCFPSNMPSSIEDNSNRLWCTNILHCLVQPSPEGLPAQTSSIDLTSSNNLAPSFFTSMRGEPRRARARIDLSLNLDVTEIFMNKIEELAFRGALLDRVLISTQTDL